MMGDSLEDKLSELLRSDHRSIEPAVDVAREIMSLRSRLNDLTQVVDQILSILTKAKSNPNLEHFPMADTEAHVNVAESMEFNAGFHIGLLKQEVDKYLDARMVSVMAEVKSEVKEAMADDSMRSKLSNLVEVVHQMHLHLLSLPTKREVEKISMVINDQVKTNMVMNSSKSFQIESLTAEDVERLLDAKIVSLAGELKSEMKAAMVHDAQGATVLDDVEEAHHSLDHNCVYDFQESMWDASAFIGTRTVGNGGSLMLGLGLLFTIVGQVLFIVIVQTSLIQDDLLLPVIREQLAHWRMRFGQHVDGMDEVTKTSLTARVCHSDMAMGTSYNQQDWVQDINNYFGLSSDFAGGRLGRRGQRGSPLNGVLLCMLAVCLWLCWIIVELRADFAWVLAFMAIPFSKHTHISLFAGGKLAIQSVGRARVVYVLSLGILRAALACYLCIVGMRYLVFTTDIDDLLLNAMSLCFILDIDEVLYAALLPRAVRVTMSCMTPVYVPNLRKLFGGGDVISLFSVVAVIGTLTLVRFTSMDRAAHGLLDIKDTLCAGSINFVFAFNPDDGAVEWAPSTEYEPSAPDTYAARAVKQLIEMDLNNLPNDTTMLSRKSTLSRVELIPSLGPGSANFASFSFCLDRIEPNYTWGRPDREAAAVMMRQILSTDTHTEVYNCSQVYRFCDDADMIHLRNICPITCGCGSPTAGLFLVHFAFGCPRKCITPRRQANAYLPCKDMSRHRLNRNKGWQRYWNGQHSYMKAYGNNVWMGNAAKLMGCNIYTWALRKQIDLCSPLVGSSIQVWCPQTCSCRQTHSDGCPGTCRHRGPNRP